MIGGIIDATNKGELAIDDSSFAVHAAQHLGAPAKEPGLRIKNVERHTGARQVGDELLGQRTRSPAVGQQNYAHATAGGADQSLFQRQPNLVFKEDEGLDQYFALGFVDRREYPREERFAVFE